LDVSSVLEQVRRLARGSTLGRRYSSTRHRRALRAWSTSDERLAAFYSQFVSAGDLCFDIGANYGNRTKVFAHLGAHVVAVEPQAACAGILHAAYDSSDRVEILQAAVSETEGEAELMIADSHVLSSLSPEWVQAVKSSGRFRHTRWNAREHVRTTTLDSMISRFGMPDFVKIDVEGYELHVLRGMTELPSYLSFELTIPECFEDAMSCIDHLSGLGTPVFNYSLGESMGLALPEWIGGDLLKRLLGQRAEPAFGDVFVSRTVPS
jgi:FkbM family methyltransferase